MPHFICRFDDPKTNKSYYLEWSTIVDAPVTYGMGIEEFKTWYRHQYGSMGMADLDERLLRVAEKGTSSLHDASVEKLIVCNRAGEGETELNYEQILQQYCLDREKVNDAP